MGDSGFQDIRKLDQLADCLEEVARILCQWKGELANWPHVMQEQPPMPARARLDRSAAIWGTLTPAQLADLPQSWPTEFQELLTMAGEYDKRWAGAPLQDKRWWLDRMRTESPDDARRYGELAVNMVATAELLATSLKRKVAKMRKEIAGAQKTAKPTREEILVPEWFARAVSLLERLETMRQEKEANINAGKDPGDPAEFSSLFEYFSRYARPIVIIAESLGIDAQGLDQLLRTGNPIYVEAAFRTLRRCQGWLLTKQTTGTVGVATDVDPKPKPAGETGVNLTANDQAIYKVLDYIKEHNDLNMVIRWFALQSAGVEKTTPVSIDLKNVTLRELLDALLSSTRATTPLGFVTKGEIITISTKEDLLKNPPTAHVGDITSAIVKGDQNETVPVAADNPQETSPPSHVVLLAKLELLRGAAERLQRYVPKAAECKGEVEEWEWPWNHAKHEAELRARGLPEASIRAEFATGWAVHMTMLDDANKDFYSGLDGAMNALESAAPVMDRADLPVVDRWTCRLRKILNSLGPFGLFRYEYPEANRQMLRATVAAIRRGQMWNVGEAYRQLDPFILDLRAVPANATPPGGKGALATAETGGSLNPVATAPAAPLGDGTTPSQEPAPAAVPASPSAAPDRVQATAEMGGSVTQGAVVLLTKPEMNPKPAEVPKQREPATEDKPVNNEPEAQKSHEATDDAKSPHDDLPDIPMDSVMAAVLAALKDVPLQRLVTQDIIAQGCKPYFNSQVPDLKTIRPHLKTLRTRMLIEQPMGKKKGVRLTSLGRKFAEKHAAQRT